MLRKLFIVSLLAAVISCQREEVVMSSSNPAEDVGVRDGRLYFKTEQLYGDKLAELASLSEEQRTMWLQQFRFKPLSNILKNAKDVYAFAEEQKLDNLSPTHWLVLNEDRLIQFGDDVVYYGDGLKYYMNVDEYNKLSNKSEITLSKRVGRFASQRLTSNVQNGRVYFDAWHKGDIGAGGSQTTIYWNDVWYKYVGEWYSTIEEDINNISSCGESALKANLWLRLKIEEKHTQNGPWSASSFYRKWSYGVNWNNTYALMGWHNTSAGCAYNDSRIPTTPFCGVCQYNGYYGSKGGQSYNPDPGKYNYVDHDTQELIQTTPWFYAEWHATVDLKKWEGDMGGSMTQTLEGLEIAPWNYSM